MYNISKEFIAAVEHGAVQYIKGRIRSEYSLDDIILDDRTAGNIVDEVTVDRYSMENENEFNIGGIYGGSAEITIKNSKTTDLYFSGAELTLSWGVQGFDMIPLGTWTITEIERINGNLLHIVARDCLNSLDVPINDGTIGAITLEARMKKVTELTGVEFAQTTVEILDLIGRGEYMPPFGSHFCPTCRAEVAAIAQYIGCIVVADRENRIEFRKIGTASVLDIPADLRFSLKLSEYNCGIRGVAYADNQGRTVIHSIDGTEKAANTVIPVFTDNPYALGGITDDETAEYQYKNYLKYAAANLKIPDWTPGEFEYYGNPALDLGDVVTIIDKDGVTKTPFLITSEHWQFRGAQTLVSAGAAENAGTNTAGGNTNTAVPPITAVVNTTKNISVIDFESTGITNGKIADVKFSVREQTAVFADITLNLRGTSDSEIEVNLFFDDEKQPAYFIGKITENEPLTAHLSAYKIVFDGIHTAYIKISGDCEILKNSSYLWGQNISEIQPEPTYAKDYEYIISENSVTITKYIGSPVNIAIPQKIEGKTVKKIGSGAFSETEVEAVKIPEGVEEIE